MFFPCCSAIFAAVSATRPRADVMYCIDSLIRRLSKTRNWAMALKVLIVIHRSLREVGPTFLEEVINYKRSRNFVLNMSHFRDDSSARALDYSAWVRAYAMFLEKRLECFRVLKYDVETEGLRTKDLNAVDFLEQLPALQQLLHRVLGCHPEGAAVHNNVIQLSFSMVASESTKIYGAVSDGIINLVDKFFEMQRHDAIKVLDIYRRAGQQAEKLSEFYEFCKIIDVGRGERFIKIEQPPASFLHAMEEYVNEAPSESTFPKEHQVVDEKSIVVLEIGDDGIIDVNEEQPPSPPPKPLKESLMADEFPDLLSFDEPNPVDSDLDEKYVLARVVPVGDVSITTPAPNLQNGAAEWELALVTTPSSDKSATTATKLAGGLDKVTLDSLYDDAMRKDNQPASYNPWEPELLTTSRSTQAHNPFSASNAVATVTNQQQAFLSQHEPTATHYEPLREPLWSRNAGSSL
ncbi:hypothetical protein RND81_08G073500 [Saponaria officinalis]|uniref:ENTH domain-containing protein n=1 Tax=Saponaria officinalis TaxID=3572 RepID=A0AAW1J4U3_SAPOF